MTEGKALAVVIAIIIVFLLRTLSRSGCWGDGKE